MYMNGPKTSSMSSSHVRIQSLDSIRPRHLTILFVHVVGAGARVISNPDTKVLDLQWALLVNLNATLLFWPTISSQVQTTHHV